MSESLSPEQRTAALLAVHFGDNWAENVPGTFQVAMRSLCAEVERLQLLNEQAAALVEAHETGDGSNLCETLAAKIRALLPSQ